MKNKEKTKMLKAFRNVFLDFGVHLEANVRINEENGEYIGVFIEIRDGEHNLISILPDMTWADDLIVEQKCIYTNN